MDPLVKNSTTISRKNFVHSCAIGVLALTSGSWTSCLSLKNAIGKPGKGPASLKISLDQNWLFGGKFNPASLDPVFDDSAFSQINLPHCVADLSWQDWKPEAWQNVWGYRRHFTLPDELKNMRVLLHFDGVMVGAAPSINGHILPPHLGGYLPFQYEITDWLKNERNVLAVAVDSRWSNVPPEGAAMGPKRIDYLEAGGIHRSVRLEVVPQIYISDVFAKPVQVLEANRRVEVTCSVNAALLPNKPVHIQVEMKRGGRVISSSQQTLSIEKTGQVEVSLSLTNLKDITLWDINNPHLYDIITTLFIEGKPLHDYQNRIGLRDARFQLDGFFLNGHRLQLFGLNRHEIFPYVGFAMPERVMRRDVEILRHEFNCNIVRCSHYPQNEAFLNACDEQGLMVWEEVPGFQYLGDEPWKELMLRDVKDMIIRDRNHPSVIIWGTRANESQNAPELYQKTKVLAKSLDNSRPSSGSMAPWSRKNWEREWDEDVFAFDDYHSDKDGSVGLEEPIKGFPYLFAEAVGQFNYKNGTFDSIYRRAAETVVQQQQALRHAQAHSKAAANPRNCGLIAWCAFEYASLINPYRGVKYPGVADIFRIPKLGASFYQAQRDPKSGPVISPNFYWDFGLKSPKSPGKNVAIFSNCDQLKLFINGRPYSILHPDSENFPNLMHPPFFTDLEIDNGVSHPELRIDGYIGDVLLLSRSFSSNPEKDQFLVAADDKELVGDGSDATRVVFRIADKFGAPRPFAGGKVVLKIDGPGTIVGDNPFDLEESGGAGAVWVKTIKGGGGRISLQATHSSLGNKHLEIFVREEEKY